MSRLLTNNGSNQIDQDWCRPPRRLSLLIGAVAITLRPTNLLIWVFFGLHHVFYCLRWGRTGEAIKATVEAAVIG